MKQAQSVLFINHTGKVSGAEKVLLHMIEGLDRANFSPSLLCATDGTLAELAAKRGIACRTMQPLNARFTKRPDALLKYFVSIVRSVRDLRARINESQPDIIHCNTVRAGIVTTIGTVGMKMPVIWHVHDVLPKHPITTIIRALARSSSRTFALCVSKATADAFTGGKSFGERVSVLHNGVDLSRFPRRSEKEAVFSSKLGISPDGFLITTVGQIAPRKNLVGLIEAFARVAATNSNVHLAVVGEAIFNEDFKYRDGLLQQVKNLGLAARVHFTGARTDIDQVMRSSDLFVLNSFEEPFGLVLVEAMSSGTPVLASSVGGIPEIITDNVSGYLVKSDDEVTLAERMTDLISNPVQMDFVVQQAITDVCPQYSIEKFLSNLHGYYRGVMVSVTPGGSVNASRQINGTTAT